MRPAALLVTIFLFWASWACASDPIPQPPKREFRAVWVATFHNIDWPSAKTLSPSRQQAEFQELVARQQAHGMNALIVQVRPSGDAFYPSELAPWSEFLTGEQGKAPEPYYDPLAFMVAAAHAAQMEFHAWLNPFRAISHDRFSSVSPDNIARQHPEWCFQYGSRLYLDPGRPEVREYLVSVIVEIVQNYDVDGIHFDDYFYPYEEPGAPFQADWATFRQYKGDHTDIRAWRRDNLDRFIEAIADTLQAVRPEVKFGISPVGIWRNERDDPRGSDTRSGYTAYDKLYADVRHWLKAGWVDYVAPQLYWSTNHPSANYANLLPWWANNRFGRHVYVGHAAFKLKQNISRHWDNPSQLPLQLALRREMDQQIQGGVFYSENVFRTNPHGLRDLLQQQYHRYPALVPPMPWKDALPPDRPQAPEGRKQMAHTLLHWRPAALAADGDSAYYYAVYRFAAEEPIDLTRADRLIGLTNDTWFVDHDPTARQADYRYYVSAFDRLHNESAAVAVPMLPGRVLGPEWQPDRAALQYGLDTPALPLRGRH